MPAKPLPWAIYARQSLDRTGAGLAVERQIKDCVKLGRQLKLHGEPVVYTDNDASASSGKRRPDYERLLEALRAGKHRHLIAWHADRLHRRPTELEEFIAVLESSGVRIHTVRSGELDLSTPTGRAIARNMGAWARLEVEQKADRKRRAIEQSAGNGLRHGGGRSFGYGRNVECAGPEACKDAAEERKHTHSADIHKLNRKEAAAIRAAFDAILRGESTTSIWKRWNERGLFTQHGNRWSGTTFRNVITRPSLAGLVTYRGEVLDGVTAAWPAIVREDKWRAVQAIITDPARRTSPGNQPRHLASGIVFCQCGSPLRAGTNSIKSKRTGQARRYTVYRCSSGNSGHTTILKDALDWRVRVETLYAVWLKRDQPAPAQTGGDDAVLVDLNTELADLRGAMKRLADAIADDIITTDAARERSAALRADEARLNSEVERLTRRVASVGVDDATWRAMWEGIDVTLPAHVPITEDGFGRFHAGRALLQSVMRSGMTDDHARAVATLGERFDDLSLDQQRALVKSNVRTTVRATGRGSRPADRIDVERL